jgi:ribosomal protein S18 acetylase RimI-like enzyme
MLLRPRLTEGTAAWRDPCVTLETGAANQPARGLYRALGYEKEDIRLTKHPLTREGP